MAKEVAEGRMHFQFAMKLYDAQAREGRYVLHERPHTAASWALTEVMVMAGHASGRVSGGTYVPVWHGIPRRKRTRASEEANAVHE